MLGCVWWLSSGTAGGNSGKNGRGGTGCRCTENDTSSGGSGGGDSTGGRAGGRAEAAAAMSTPGASKLEAEDVGDNRVGDGDPV